jgi:hypothetical protein
MKKINLQVTQLGTVKWSTSTEKPNFSAYVAVGDFNGDGVHDLAINICDVNGDTPDVQLFLGSKDGVFSLGTGLLGARIPTYQAANPIWAADMNRDGITDIVIGNSNGDGDTKDGVYGGAQVIYLSTTDKKFKVFVSQDRPYAHHTTVADINGDGYLDAFFTATGVGPSLLAYYEPSTQSFRFTTDGLPEKMIKVSTAEAWELVSQTRATNGDTINVFADFHQHNTQFLDVDRDGDQDLVMFFSARETMIFPNVGKTAPVFSNAERIAVSTQLSFLSSNDSTMTVDWKAATRTHTMTVWKSGFNPYETVTFDIDGDGWSDILANGTYEDERYFIDEAGKTTYQTGSDHFNDGTLYQIFISNGKTLINETEKRIAQIGSWENTGYHDGLIDNLKIVDLNGDGHLDFMSNNATSTAANVPSWTADKTNTAFMLNDGTGKFTRVEIAGLEHGSFSPVPIMGKLGFIHVRTAGVVFSSTDGLTHGTFFVTNVPWTIGDQKNNFLYSTSANDPIDGGGGIDTFYANGRSTGFKLSKADSGLLSITDLSGLGGSDTLTNVERIRFDDVNVAVDIDGAAGKAYRLYKAAFNRDPMQGDRQGLGYWIAQVDAGMELPEVAARFIDSSEFRQIYGSTPSNAEFLTKVYQNVLGRNPDPSGYEWWLNELNTNPLKTKAKVLADFSESPENQSALVSLVANGIAYDPWTGG